MRPTPLDPRDRNKGDKLLFLSMVTSHAFFICSPVFRVNVVDEEDEEAEEVAAEDDGDVEAGRLGRALVHLDDVLVRPLLARARARGLGPRAQVLRELRVARGDHGLLFLRPRRGRGRGRP